MKELSKEGQWMKIFELVSGRYNFLLVFSKMRNKLHQEGGKINSGTAFQALVNIVGRSPEHSSVQLWTSYCLQILML